MGDCSAELAERAPNLAPPPNNPRFPLFDGLRAVAALTVFAGHTVTGVVSYKQHPELFQFAVKLAYQGVAIFFAISGFLLYRPFVAARHAGTRLRLRDYAARRVARIVPAYWVALSVFLALGWVHGVTSHNWPVFYGFGQVYGADSIDHGIGAAWTLCVEVTFYVALPLFALGAWRLSRRGYSGRVEFTLLALLTAGSLAFTAHFNGFQHIAAASTLPATFIWFAVGMTLAMASVAAEQHSRLRRAARMNPVLAWLLAAITFVGLHLLTRHARPLGTAGTAVVTYVLYAVTALLVALPAVFVSRSATRLPHKVLGSAALTWIGLVSYGFYLYHTVIIDRVARSVHDRGVGGYLFVALVSLASTAASAAASYYVVERPILRTARTRGRRARNASQTAIGA